MKSKTEILKYIEEVKKELDEVRSHQQGSVSLAQNFLLGQLHSLEWVINEDEHVLMVINKKEYSEFIKWKQQQK